MRWHSILSSSDSEERWVNKISQYFEKEVAIHNVPVSVFSVPKAICAIKPEAYTPQVIAFGPYHHMEPELYPMEKYKLATVKSSLSLEQILNFQELVIEKLKELEPVLRACYHKYLDHDGDALAWIVAIDGLFLLDILRGYGHIEYSQRKNLKQDAVLCRDVMMLENQIPVILLKEIRNSLRFTSVHDGDDLELFLMLRGFCQIHSPLKLARISNTPPYSSCLHLLDLMYFLIVNHQATTTRPQEQAICLEKTDGRADAVQHQYEEEENDLILNVGDIVEMGMRLGIVKSVFKPVKVIEDMPWEKISNLLGLKTGNEHDKENRPTVEEITIPSVSHLFKFAGVKFSHTTGGIGDIKFVQGEATLYLPIITLNANSEVVLRNLVAYEVALSNSTGKLAQYLDFICGIVDTAEDAQLLREKGIIKGDLSNEEIADLFNGINRLSAKARNKTVDEINEYYNKRPMVKGYNFVKKRVFASWRILTLSSTILLLLLFLMNSFCQVYGCQNFFGRSI
ncbi:hypothetical protein RJ639_041139 [Escallonia herrerae]|uniref:Uncharacterized protein n=1 Tax=Escallonia herrerae TaxID=1293975 RepID=A0AA88WGB6_9ASTE|nr:hypothetical protein RJ639_041139 [Escallonia herrerae]